MLQSLLKLFACTPTGGGFFGLPPWYKYLDGEVDSFGKCIPTVDLYNPNSLWGIALAGVEILLRIVAMVAVGFIIYAGFQYMTSNGEPEKAKNAKDTIVNSLVGLVIAIVASTLVAFVGNSIK